jgi:subtilisin family serine protease
MIASRRFPAPSVFSALASICLAATVAYATPASGDTGGAAPAAIAGQLLVKPGPEADSRAFAAALERAGARQIGVVPQLGVRIVEVPVVNRGAALSSLRSQATVAFAEPNGLTPPAEVVPNDALWVNQWSQPKVHADRAWNVTTGSPAVKIAILDSGVDPAQPDLADALLSGRDFYNDDLDPSDDNGHGTQVAGVAAGRSGNGVGVAGYCGRCSIIPVKIAGSNGYASFSAMASGIVWAADEGARVINLSFAGSSGSATVRDAIAYAHSHGALVTASAGNYGTSSPTYPAAYPGVLAVASTNGSDSLESYSSYGSWVQLAAPGCNYGTWHTSSSSLFGNFCGTSSAAPAVAGIAALAFSYAPAATKAEIEGALESSAVRVGDFVRFGRADAWATLAALGAGQPTATAPVSGVEPTVLASNAGPLNGSPQPGQYLWASGGGWSGAAAIGLAFQWKRCDTSGANCGPIPGAVWRTYTPTSADSGYTLRTAVTATNTLGSASAISLPSPVVGGTTNPTPQAPPPATATTTFSGSISAKQPSKAFALTVGSGNATATLNFSKAPSLTLTLLSADGATIGTVSGLSGIELTRTLAAGAYRLVVSGRVAKGSASFTLGVRYTAP